MLHPCSVPVFSPIAPFSSSFILICLIYRLLINKGASLPNYTIAGVNASLFYALIAPSPAPLQELLAHGQMAATCGEKNRTLLQVMVTAGRLRHFEDTAVFLLGKGVQIDAKDKDGK